MWLKHYLSRMEIAKRTVQRWLANSSFLESPRAARRRRPSLIDPYKRYVIADVARGISQWLAALQRTHSSRLQGFIQSYVSSLSRDITGYPQSDSTQVGFIETPKPVHKSVPIIACTAGKASLHGVLRGCLCINQRSWMRQQPRKNWHLIRQASPKRQKSLYGLAQAFHAQ